jgi:DNA-binding LytR/AlgR family response regulator
MGIGIKLELKKLGKPYIVPLVTPDKGDGPVRIAICDDDVSLRAGLREVIDTCNGLSEDTIITEYQEGNELIDSHLKCPHDIIFLDIEMDGISGLEVGQKIRDSDRNVIIIFITNYMRYVLRSFRIEPFDYIIKPVDGEVVSEVLERALKKHKEQHFIVNIKWRENSYAIKVCDIVFIESDLRHIVIVTVDNRYKVIGKLDEYELRLAPYGFLRCHQSFIVNMNYIKCIGHSSISTTLNHDIYMSTRRKQDCLKAFTEFLVRFRV